MSDEKKTPLDQALDLFVYAPIGLLSLAREQLPKAMERGRQQVETQMTMARLMGEFAVQKGRGDAEKAVRDIIDRLSPPTTPSPSPSPSPASAPASSSAAASDPGGEQTKAAEATRPPAAAASPAASPSGNGSSAGATTPPAGDGLAIPGYDSLSASQVVPRLASLSGDELAAVQAYESATRARRTILNKIAQLQASTPN